MEAWHIQGAKHPPPGRKLSAQWYKLGSHGNLMALRVAKHSIIHWPFSSMAYGNPRARGIWHRNKYKAMRNYNMPRNRRDFHRPHRMLSSPAGVMAMISAEIMRRVQAQLSSSRETEIRVKCAVSFGLGRPSDAGF